MGGEDLGQGRNWVEGAIGRKGKITVILSTIKYYFFLIFLFLKLKQKFKVLQY